EEAGEVGCNLGRGPAVVRRRGRGAEARQVEPDDPVSVGETRHPLGPGLRGFAIAVHQHNRLWRRPRRAAPIVPAGYGEAGPDLDFLHRFSTRLEVPPAVTANSVENCKSKSKQPMQKARP